MISIPRTGPRSTASAYARPRSRTATRSASAARSSSSSARAEPTGDRARVVTAITSLSSETPMLPCGAACRRCGEARRRGGSMGGNPVRVGLASAVISVSLWLVACPLGHLRVRIPDFATSDVRGLRLYRVDDASGQLVAAGSIQFLGLETSEQLGGETLAYR